MLSLILICFIAMSKTVVKRSFFFFVLFLVCLFLSIIKLIGPESVIWLFGVTAPLNITIKTSKSHYFANRGEGKVKGVNAKILREHVLCK